MPRKNRSEIKSWYEKPEPEICPLCGRAIPDSERDAHHWVPKSRGGRATQPLHRICHRQIHALFTETELARTYSTPETILAHPDIRAFVDWVRKKPPDFSDTARKSKRIRKDRRDR